MHDLCLSQVVLLVLLKLRADMHVQAGERQQQV
jgi:hypothetical protein